MLKGFFGKHDYMFKMAVTYRVDRAIQRGVASAPQLPANHPLSDVDFGAFYVGENPSHDGMFCDCHLVVLDGRAQLAG